MCIRACVIFHTSNYVIKYGVPADIVFQSLAKVQY